MGFEPTFKAWEALVLPLNYTREFIQPSSINSYTQPSASEPCTYLYLCRIASELKVYAASLKSLLNIELSFHCCGGLRPVDLSEEPAATLVARYLLIVLRDALHLIANKPYDHVFGVFV